MNYLTELLLINFIKGGDNFWVRCKADMGTIWYHIILRIFKSLCFFNHSPLT